jgi:hypothetical protein
VLACLILSTTFHCTLAMTRPKKNTQHCRRICQLRFYEDSGSSSDSTDTDDSLEYCDDLEIIDEFSGEVNIRNVDEVLQWVESACCRSMEPYSGSSRRTYF